MNEDELPITLIAHDERGVLGTASLKDSDLDILPDLKPWISSVYVNPDFRGTGVGSALAAEIERIAARKGYPKIYLFNPISQGVFEKLGWKILKTVSYGGKELGILYKELTPEGASAGG
jgi:GNAT superfamily N-acetyltransferase